MLTNTNIACSSRVHEITRDNGGFPCLFACFREAEGGGGLTDRRFIVILIMKKYGQF